MSKINSQSQTTDDKGNARLATYCANHNPKLIWREILKRDIGIDGEIEFCDEFGNSMAEIIKVQLKSTESKNSYIKNESDKHNNFTFYAEKDDVEYWQSLNFDVLLIIFDGRDGKQDLYVKKIEGFNPKQVDSKKVKILFNKKTDFIHEKYNDFHSRFCRKNSMESKDDIKILTSSIHDVEQIFNSLVKMLKEKLSHEKDDFFNKESHKISEKVNKESNVYKLRLEKQTRQFE
jgi:hypothetical protein